MCPSPAGYVWVTAAWSWIQQRARSTAAWAAPTTLVADRKAMLRLVIEAVAVNLIDVPRHRRESRCNDDRGHAWRYGS
jgi:hypothetical protein